MGLMKPNVCVFIKHGIKIYSKATIHVNEVILTPFSPFDIKCKKLNLLSANTTKWSNTFKQFASWHLKSSYEKPLEMISYCILLETNIFIKMVFCVASDFKSDARQRKS